MAGPRPQEGGVSEAHCLLGGVARVEGQGSEFLLRFSCDLREGVAPGWAGHSGGDGGWGRSEESRSGGGVGGAGLGRPPRLAPPFRPPQLDRAPALLGHSCCPRPLCLRVVLQYLSLEDTPEQAWAPPARLGPWGRRRSQGEFGVAGEGTAGRGQGLRLPSPCLASGCPEVTPPETADLQQKLWLSSGVVWGGRG